MRQKLTTYQRRKLKAADWVEDQSRLFWRNPADGNYYAPVKAWVMMKARAK
jgi:hypothetical protein